METAHTIYGLRLRGEREVRYVGLTRNPVEYRRSQHIYRAVGAQSATPFGKWLNDNRAAVEAFKIAECDNRETAKATEKVVIAVCEVTGNRLFNLAHRRAA